MESNHKICCKYNVQKSNSIMAHRSKSLIDRHSHDDHSNVSKRSIRRIFNLNLITSAYNSTLCILFLVCVISPSYQEEAFSIDKLLEYNSLANCIGQIHKDFEQCNTKGAEKAKSVITSVELSSEWTKRLQCCGMWKLRECWMKAARMKCTKAQADQVFKLPHLFMPSLATECSEFTPESGKCSIPMWMIASVVSVALFILVTCLCTVIYCIRRFQQKRYRHRRRQRRSVTSNTQQTQLMNSVNGTKPIQNGNGNIKKPYMNGNSKIPVVTIDVDSGEECRSLNGPDSAA